MLPSFYIKIQFDTLVLVQYQNIKAKTMEAKDFMLGPFYVSIITVLIL